MLSYIHLDPQEQNVMQLNQSTELVKCRNAFENAIQNFYHIVKATVCEVNDNLIKHASI